MQRCRIWSKCSGDTKLSSLTELEPGHDHVDIIHDLDSNRAVDPVLAVIMSKQQ
jgi:hypothetical protein